METDKKLLLTLFDKTRYAIHYRILQLYMKLGMKLKKIHRVIEFDQLPWLKTYIELNTNLRKKATTDSLKKLPKLMNNAVYGKSMENIRNRTIVDLIRFDNKDDVERYFRKRSRPEYASRKKITGFYLMAIHMHKTNIFLNKLDYIGFVILELSKLLMYEFYYNHLKKKYDNNCRLLYTDTDSFFLEIETEDVYKDMQEDKDLYDFSNYEKDHFFFSEKNKKVAGKFKDETAGIPIHKLIALKTEMYTFVLKKSDLKEKK